MVSKSLPSSGPSWSSFSFLDEYHSNSETVGENSKNEKYSRTGYAGFETQHR